MNGRIEREILPVVLRSGLRQDIQGKVRIAETGFESLETDFLSRERLEFQDVFPLGVRHGRSGPPKHAYIGILYRQSFVGMDSSYDIEGDEAFTAGAREFRTKDPVFFLGLFVFPFQRKEIDVFFAYFRIGSGRRSPSIRDVLSDSGVFPFLDNRHIRLNRIVKLEECRFLVLLDGTDIGDAALKKSGFVGFDILYILRVGLEVVRDEAVDVRLSCYFRIHLETHLFRRIYVFELRQTLYKGLGFISGSYFRQNYKTYRSSNKSHNEKRENEFISGFFHRNPFTE